jgi:hypothetical protein
MQKVVGWILIIIPVINFIGRITASAYNKEIPISPIGIVMFIAMLIVGIYLLNKDTMSEQNYNSTDFSDLNKTIYPVEHLRPRKTEFKIASRKVEIELISAEVLDGYNFKLIAAVNENNPHEVWTFKNENSLNILSKLNFYDLELINLSKGITRFNSQEKKTLEESARRFVNHINGSIEPCHLIVIEQYFKEYFPNSFTENTFEGKVFTSNQWIPVTASFKPSEEVKQAFFRSNDRRKNAEKSDFDLVDRIPKSDKVENGKEKLSASLPNFVDLINKLSSPQATLHLKTDNSKKLEYITPIQTYGKIMGYNHYVIERNPSGIFEIYQISKGNKGEPLFSSKRFFTEDQNFQQYNDMMESIVMEQIANPLYMQITTSGFNLH